MFTVMMLPNAERFLELAARSCGEVLLHLPDGSLCDLKRDHTARQLLKTLRPGREGLQISLSDRGDAPAFLRYLQEAALGPERAACPLER